MFLILIDNGNKQSTVRTRAHSEARRKAGGELLKHVMLHIGLSGLAKASYPPTDFFKIGGKSHKSSYLPGGPPSRIFRCTQMFHAVIKLIADSGLIF